MRRIISSFFLMLVFHLTASAQSVEDSIYINDSIRAIVDTSVTNDSIGTGIVSQEVSRRPSNAGQEWEWAPGIPVDQQIRARHPYFRFGTRAVLIRSNLRQVKGKEDLFYATLGLVFLFAVLKLAFSKYVNDLFRVFFRTTMKQRQIREQLMQTPLPSLLFNLFFILTTGLYIDFLLHDRGYQPVGNFWIMYLYCCTGLTLIYLVKYIGLKICGWIFNVKHAAESYIFIVFIINKMIGIFLLPVTVLLAFSREPMFSVIMVLSWCGIGILLFYRFVLAISAVRNEVRFNLFHFILYLAALEIAPLLLIYRVLLSFVK
ncbi:MAG: DUF4271 domain-containing protein [Chitinophagaceae bacterium]